MDNQINPQNQNNQQFRQNRVNWMIATLLAILLIAGGTRLALNLNNKSKTPINQGTAAPNQTEVSNLTNSNLTEAIRLLEAIPEIQIIKEAVTKAGRKPFFTLEAENGDVVVISLRESFTEDLHTSRIDTFNVNLKSKEVTVEDVAANKEITLDEWKKTVKPRFE